MSLNFMTSVPYVSHRSRFIVFLSLSNLDLVRPEGTLFLKSALGRISEIKTRRTPASLSFSMSDFDVIVDFFWFGDGADVIPADRQEDDVCFFGCSCQFLLHHFVDAVAA